jgi:hypothetical protein
VAKKITKESSTPPKAEQETNQATAAPPEAPRHVDLVAAGGMKKFNFNRPAPAGQEEQRQGTPLRQSYEDMRDGAKGPGVEEWKATDKARSDLTSLYRNLQEDERYAPEYKREQAWAAYEQTRAHIERLAPEAREKMLSSAENLERMSIPTPEGEGVITKETTKLMLTAHERTRLEGLLARDKESSGRGPFKPKPREILKAEYERGLSEGGPGGGATVRAVVGLVRDWGLDIDSIVDDKRRAHHHGALQDAQAARERAQMIGRTVPEPPFQQNIRAATGSYRAKPTVLAQQEKKPLFGKRKRPSWK